MKLLRLRLKDFRGIDDREVTFADSGITVVTGRNEAGKSSMIDALDALLETSSSSKSKPIRALAPAGRDVGTEVEAEIVAGHWHFTYFKRFNRSAATELRIHSPHPEQLTGKDAETRANEILSASADLALFKAVRLMQSDDPTLSSPTGSTALTRALDRAVGTADTADGADDLLALVTAEYGRYYTLKSGRPTAELQHATGRVSDARSSFARLAQGVDAVAADGAVLEAALAERTRLQRSHELCRTESGEIDERLAEAATAITAFENAEKALAVADKAVQWATREVADREARSSRLAALRKREVAARERRDAAVTQLTLAGEQAAQAERELDSARVEFDQATAARVADIQDKLTTAQAAVDANGVDEGVLATARTLTHDLAVATARWEAAAASFAVVALGDRHVTVDGQVVTDAEFRTGTTDSIVEVDGLARVTIRAGADTSELARRVDELRGHFETLCGAHQVASMAELESLGRTRVESVREVESLRSELTRPAMADAADRVTAMRTAVEAKRATQREQQIIADAAGAELATLAVDIADLVAGQTAAASESSDEQALAVVEAARGERLKAGEAVTKLKAELDVLAVTDLERRRATLDAELTKLQRAISAADHDAVAASTRIEVCRTDNRLDELNDASAELADAEGEEQRVQARASAAKLLLGTLLAKRQESHARYADPFRRRLEELSVPLFGAGVQFGVDDDLTITSRTTGGVTVGYDALSGGAREQIGLVARLACAILVDEADGVPVIIDDALGNSDNERVEAMAGVLSQAGDAAQIIVLTCVPERYEHVDAKARVAV